jgi:O-acetyl-ADP-ribose deacetylase (regulator of RNase III)
MPFVTEINKDITTYEVDVIVNSIGVYGKLYGFLCKRIIEEAKSLELKSYIDSLVNNEIGTIFETKGYALPVKEIFHMVTPYRIKDDENLTLLKKAYLDLINRAIEKGYKSIALPLIGNGANGYSQAESYEAAMDAIGEILYIEEKEDKDIINMILILKLKEKDEVSYSRDRRLSNKLISYDCCSSVEKNSEYIRKQKKIQRVMEKVDYNKFFNSGHNYTRPFDFIIDYCAVNNINEKVLSKGGMSRQKKHRFLKKEHIKREDVFRLIIMFKFDITLSIQFLNICGHGLSSLSEVDMFVVDYLLGKYTKVKTRYELGCIAYEKCGVYLSFDDNKTIPQDIL